MEGALDTNRKKAIEIKVSARNMKVSTMEKVSMFCGISI